MTSTPAELPELESRVSKLESKLGVSLSKKLPPPGSDINSLLDRFNRMEIERQPPVPSSIKSSDISDSSKRLALHEDFRVIDRLLGELGMSPLAGPAMAGASNPPLIYRRQEILASSESMKRDMELLARIRDLTSIGRKVSDSNESTFVDCPIVSSDRYNITADPDAVDRLDQICLRAANLNKRALFISHRTDELLNSYSQVMGALAEKIVLAEEQVRGES
eukprot:scaffold26007_cov73-Cyclotella_meneghiniana.AAC.2